MKPLLLAMIVGVTLGVLGGCQLFNGPTPVTAQEVLEHAYTTEIVGCAAVHKGDHDADMRCRAKVDERYGLK